MKLAFLFLALAGCASLNSVSVTPIPANRAQNVSAQASRWIILGLNFDNDYADEVTRRLAEKCPNGRVSGILTKDETYMYFLFFVLRRDIKASGYCERYGVASAGTAKRGAHGRKYNSVEDEGEPE